MIHYNLTEAIPSRMICILFFRSGP